MPRCRPPPATAAFISILRHMLRVPILIFISAFPRRFIIGARGAPPPLPSMAADGRDFHADEISCARLAGLGRYASMRRSVPHAVKSLHGPASSRPPPICAQCRHWLAMARKRSVRHARLKLADDGRHRRPFFRPPISGFTAAHD